MQISIQLLALTLFFRAFEADACSEYITLFRSPDGDENDKTVNISKNTPDLATLDFDNQAQAYHLHGTVILYENAYYNVENPSAWYDMPSFFEDCTYVWGQSPILESTSSVRFVGSVVNNVHVPSLTLFQKPYFAGLTSELVLGNKPVLDHSDSQSLVISGLDDWTFYNQYNYYGKGYCVKSNADPIRASSFPDAASLGFSLVGKLSVEKGCWAYHGVPVNITSS